MIGYDPNVRNGWKADIRCALINPMLRTSRLVFLIYLAVVAAGCEKTQRSPSQAGVYDAARCGGVPKNWSKQGSEFYELTYISELAIGPNRLKWNGQSTTSEALRKDLETQREMAPFSNVQLIFEVGTDCRVIQAARENVDRSFQCNGERHCIEYTDAELAKFLPPPPRP